MVGDTLRITIKKQTPGVDNLKESALAVTARGDSTSRPAGFFID